MSFDYYFIFNLDEFLALGLVSKTYTLDLEGVGTETFLAVHGSFNSLVFRDVLLPLDSGAQVRPGIDGTYTAVVNQSRNVYLGIATA